MLSDAGMSISNAVACKLHKATYRHTNLILLPPIPAGGLARCTASPFPPHRRTLYLLSKLRNLSTGPPRRVQQSVMTR